MNLENLDVYTEKAIEMTMEYGPQLILAIIVLFIGLSIIKSMSRFVEHVLGKRNVDPTLTPFLVNILEWGLKALLLISVASMVGIATSSFIAVLGAAGLAIGLALQGSLANFAGGVIILIFRPFGKGDYIEAQGEAGTVISIDVFATIIKTVDNKKVILPNGQLAGGVVKNFTGHEFRRVDLPIGISYDDDIREAAKALVEMCKNNDLVVNEPEPPFVGVTDYGDNSVNLIVKAWVRTENYWPAFYSLNEQIKYTLDEKKISIPFPQRDVHIINQ